MGLLLLFYSLNYILILHMKPTATFVSERLQCGIAKQSYSSISSHVERLHLVSVSQIRASLRLMFGMFRSQDYVKDPASCFYAQR